MEQVCSMKKCYASITIPEGQTVAMFDGKPVCQKCDHFLNAPLPTNTRKTGSAKEPYKEPEVYKEEVINDGRALLAYPAHLPIPKPGYGVRRIQVFDKDGNMHYEYKYRFVGSTRDPA